MFTTILILTNIGNAGAATGKLALESKVDWSCTGGDTNKINDEVADIDKADMAKILR